MKEIPMTIFSLTKSNDLVILTVPNILLLSERFVTLISDAGLAMILLYAVCGGILWMEMFSSGGEMTADNKVNNH